MSPPLLKQSLSVIHKIGAVYTGGKVQLSQDDQYIFCTCGDAIKVLDTKSGKVVYSIKQDDDEVTCFSLSPDDKVLVVAYRSLLIRQWDWKEKKCVRAWKSIHTAPVISMSFDATSTLLATGSGDNTIKIWDVIQQYCTHNLKGCHSVVNYLKFHPVKMILFSCSGSIIYVWDLQTSKLKVGLETHYGTVTSVDFTADGSKMASSGRDKVVVTWNVETLQPINTIPVMEVIESVFWLPEGYPQKLGFSCDNPVVMVGGSLGYLRGIDTVSGQSVYRQTEVATTVPVSEADNVTSVILHSQLCPTSNQIMVVTYDHHIVFYNADGGELTKQFVGFNDEVLDLKFAGLNDSHLVVATNSEYVKVYDLSTHNCQILIGHTDIVLAVEVFNDKQMFASSSKDNTIRLWKMDANHKFECMGIAVGHTHSVGAIAIPKLSARFLVSGSEDCCLKVWNIPESLTATDPPQHLSVQFTQHAHEKDINSVSVAPNDKLLVTGSLDKTAKLWHLENQIFLGTFRGHKRSIWCVQFSPTDQVVATSSADGTLKIWSITDFTCVKTFQGHDTSVLKVTFITRGMQLLSSGSDGLLKIWSIKDNECLKTYDEHNDKLWALAVSSNEDVVATGGADSMIALWKDVTETEWEESQAKEEEQIIKLQKLSNLIKGKNFRKAIGLALTLEQPFRLLNIFKGLMDQSDGRSCLKDVIGKLRLDQIDVLLRFCVQWNTNSKHCHVAQGVVHTVLSQFSHAQLLECANITENMEGLLPYTQRHFSRMNRLVEQTMFVDYTWHRLRAVTAPSTQKVNENNNLIEESLTEESYYIDAEQFSSRSVSSQTTSTTVQEPSTSTDVQEPSTSTDVQDVSEKSEMSEKENVSNKVTLEEESDSEADNESVKISHCGDVSEPTGKCLSEKNSNSRKSNRNNNCLKSGSPVDFEWDANTRDWSGKDDGLDEDENESDDNVMKVMQPKKKSRKSLQMLVKKMKAQKRQNKEKMQNLSPKKRKKSVTK